MKKALFGILFTAALLFAPTGAQGATILPNCGTCGLHNTAWDLNYSLIDDTNNIYRLTIVATYGSPVDFVYINAIAFKIESLVNKYEANPTVTGPAEDTWNVQFGGINSGGCSGSGNGFWCANSAGFGATHGAAGTTDTWQFTFNIDNLQPNLGATTIGSFKAQFTDALGNKVGSLLSENVTLTTTPPTTPPLVPEPATLLLLGAGLAGVAVRLRLRRRRR